MSYDPIIQLNRHIALLHLLSEAEHEASIRRGILLPMAKYLGRTLREKLWQSKAHMKENRMWVNDIPLEERRYAYSLQGNRKVYEIEQDDLNLHIRMIQWELDKEFYYDEHAVEHEEG